jgi:Lrp/AsnC family transcriptional regulator, leucine-responsive regulatory protein
LKFDETDLALLRLLERDGKMAIRHLARTVRLSPAACHERVRKLEASGVIQGYRAVLDWRLLGAGFEAWVETVLVSPGRCDAFVKFLNEASLVVSAQRLVQSNAFLLQVTAPTTECWREFMDAARGAGFSLEVTRFNLALASVKPARKAMPTPLRRVI